jgi:uncharacterized protein
VSLYSVLEGWEDEYPSTRYVTPFAVFILLLALTGNFAVDARWEAPARAVTLAAVCFVCWPRELPIRPNQSFASIAVGIGVFLIWIAPDTLIAGYRAHRLFSNTIVGHAHSSISAAALHSEWVLAWRTVRAVVVVPIVEELFWRAWLMRWLINPDFRSVPLGAYRPFAFWITAMLFASEHGPYWDVGLITGVIYNWWMIRSKSIADCILLHATTNAILSGYIIATAQWQYWQ